MSLRGSLRLPDIFKRIGGVFTFPVLSGLVQWLTGDYYRDADGDIVDGTICDKAKQQGAVAFEPSGYALSFDGINDLINTDIKSLWLGVDGTNIAFETQFRRTASGSEDAVFDFNSTNRFYLRFLSDNTLALSVGGSTPISASVLSFFDGEWHKLRILIVGTSVQVWIDSTLVINSTSAGIQNFTSVASGYYTAVFTGTGGFFEGHLAYFKFWNNITTLEEMDTVAPNIHDLRLIEGGGQYVADYSPNKLDGLISGATWLSKVSAGVQVKNLSYNVAGNFLVDTEAVTTGLWGISNSTVTDSGLTNPHGNKVYNFLDNAVNSTHRLFCNATYSLSGSGKVVTIQCVVKQINGGNLKVIEDTESTRFIDVDLLNNTFFTENNAVGRITDLGNGYKLVSMTYIRTSNTSRPNFYTLNSLGTFVYAGDGATGVMISQIQAVEGYGELAYIHKTTGLSTRAWTQPVNIMGAEIDSTTDIFGNPITDFVYAEDRYKLPTGEVSIYDGNQKVVPDSKITVSGNFKMKMTFVHDDTNVDAIFLDDHPTSTYVLSLVNNTMFMRFDGSADQTDTALSFDWNDFDFGVLELTIWRVGSNLIVFVNGVRRDLLTGASQNDLTITDFWNNNENNDGLRGYPKSIEIEGVGSWSASSGWVDSIGSNDGIETGTPITSEITKSYANNATAKTGIGLSQNGTTDKVSWGDLDLTGDYTVNILVRGDLADGSICLVKTTGLSDYIRLYQVGVAVKMSGGSDFLIGTGDYLDTSWKMVTVVRSGSNISIYKNGVLDATGVADASTLSLGETYDLSAFDFASIQIFDAIALNSNQVAELYNNPQIDCPSDVSRSNLLLSLRLDDGTTTTAKDYSGNANDGIITGATWIYGLEYPVKQLILSNFNKGGSDELIFGVTDGATVDIDNNPIVYRLREDVELSFPFDYHDGTSTDHVAAMAATDGLSVCFWTEIVLGGIADVIFSKGVNLVNGMLGVYVRNNSGTKITLRRNAVDADLADLAAYTGVHSHIITVDNIGRYVWYIDGVNVQEGVLDTLTQNTQAIYWGQDTVDARGYIGKIGDPMYYNRKLSESEALAIYNFQKGNYI